MKTTSPNYTQIPNDFLDIWMPQLSDTAFRILMIIARQTFGWMLDKDTGMRKKDDWIAYTQLEQKTGRRKAAIAAGLRELEEKGLIEIRDMEGNILKTKEERHGKRLFYRVKVTSCRQTSSESEVRKAKFGKRTNKRNTYKINLYKIR